MEIEQAKQSFSSFFEDAFSARNIIEASLRFWKLIAAFTVLGGIGAVLLTLFVIHPRYVSQATLFAWRAETGEDGAVNDRYAYQNLTMGGMLAADYQVLLTSDRVQDQVRRRLVEQFGDKVKYDIKADYTRNTRIIAIHATAGDPKVAQAAAQTTVEVFAKVISDILQFSNVQIVDVAKLPDRAVNIRPLRNGALGGVLGFAAGFALAMFFGLMDQTIKNPEQVDSFFDKSMLGVIPLIKDKIPDEPLYTMLDSKEHTELSEAFRLARANLPYLCPDAGKDEASPARVFLFTSTAKGEGKSNCVASLAYLTASAGKKVLLIDSDLRRPMLGKIFDQSQSQHGIVTYLTGESTWEESLIRDVSNLPLDLLPCSKPLPPNPSEILMSNSFGEMLKRERAHYDYIFIDCAPALFLADPLIVVPLVDAIVFVISCSRAKIGLIKQTLRQIAQISEKTPLGLLVNRFDRSDISCKYGYYRYKDYDRYYHYQKSYYVSDSQQ